MRRLISLYTGAGGLDLGFEAAGFDCSIAVEMDAEAVVTLRANRDWKVLDRDIHQVSSAELLAAGGFGEGEADLLVGGPPCQPFSKSGYWHSGDSKRLEDPRARTLDEYLRVLRDSKPQAFLLENVPGLAFYEKSEGLTFLRHSIENINREIGTNYSISARQLNACAYGVPQTRERVFVVGHREGLHFDFPQPTHELPPKADMAGSKTGALSCMPSGLEPARTAWDAIGHLERDDNPALQPRGKWAALLPTIPEGHNYLFHTDRGDGIELFGWRRRYWSMLLKLAKARPSWTLTAQPGPAIGPFHWRSRRLSAAELCCLQTFPRDYKIIGSVMSAHRQVGNAVPSALAEILGREIRRQFFGEEAVDSGLPTLLPCRASSTPAPEDAAPVPAEYLGLVADHAPHPGTGLGPGALAREI